MLTFCKKLPWNGITGETDLWREMNFVTGPEHCTGPFEEEEEGTGVASDVVKVQSEDPATPGPLI